MRERTVVITGAGSGLGAAVAHALAGLETRLYLADPDGDVLDRTVAAVSGTQVTGVRTDVRDEFDVERLLETAARGGEIDCVVVASAVCHERSDRSSISGASYAAFDDHLRTNARGVFATIKEALPHLAADARILVPVEQGDPVADRGSYGVSLASAVAVAREFAADADSTVCVVETGLPVDSDENSDADLEAAAELLRWAAWDAPAEDVDGAVVDRSTTASRSDAG